MKRVLVTGSREWMDWPLLCQALNVNKPDVVVHGGARGADAMAGEWAKVAAKPAEIYPASGFPSPRARNQHMVDQGADVCLAFANSWASGTGMCARMARKAGIPVIDYGVDTRHEAKPSVASISKSLEDATSLEARP